MPLLLCPAIPSSKHPFSAIRILAKDTRVITHAVRNGADLGKSRAEAFQFPVISAPQHVLQRAPNDVVLRSAVPVGSRDEELIAIACRLKHCDARANAPDKGRF
jgi:hypothetical protein